MRHLRSHEQRRHASDLLKVVLELEPSDWHSFSAENMWAEDLDGGRFRLRNSPFAAYGYSLNDVVLGEMREDRIVVTRVLFHSGHSTYRAILAPTASIRSPIFQEHWAPLAEIGCTFEQSEDHLLAIDVPPGADIHRTYRFLEKGEKDGVWDFEEAHCGHSV